MPRFFIAASNIFGGIAYINGKDAEHIRVLRIKEGEQFVVCDGNGMDYHCRLSRLTEDGAEGEVLNHVPSLGEPTVFCSIFTAFSKGDKLETVIQKSVEIGASEIILFPSHRCVSKPEGISIMKKLSRWQKIAEEAAKQSGRGRIPNVTAAPTFEAAIKAAAKADLPLFLYENEEEFGLKSALEKNSDFKHVSIVSGPEGGFEPDEAALARELGMVSVSLGARILRCETAPICALTGVMLYTGNL